MTILMNVFRLLYVKLYLWVDLFSEECNDEVLPEGEGAVSDLYVVPDPPSPLTTDRLGLSDDEPVASPLTTAPTEPEKVFKYLMSMPVKTLRVFCKELHIKQSGIKDEYCKAGLRDDGAY